MRRARAASITAAARSTSKNSNTLISNQPPPCKSRTPQQYAPKEQRGDHPLNVMGRQCLFTPGLPNRLHRRSRRTPHLTGRLCHSDAAVWGELRTPARAGRGLGRPGWRHHPAAAVRRLPLKRGALTQCVEAQVVIWRRLILRTLDCRSRGAGGGRYFARCVATDRHPSV